MHAGRNKPRFARPPSRVPPPPVIVPARSVMTPDKRDGQHAPRCRETRERKPDTCSSGLYQLTFFVNIAVMYPVKQKAVMHQWQN